MAGTQTSNSDELTCLISKKKKIDIDLEMQEKTENKSYSFNVCHAITEFAGNPCGKTRDIGFYILFGIIALICIILYILHGFVGFLSASALCIGMSIYSIFSFNDIFFLKRQIKNYGKLNNEFIRENKMLKESNIILDQDLNELEETADALKKNQKKLRKNVKILKEFAKYFKEQKDKHKQVATSLFNSLSEWINDFENDENQLFRKVLRAARDQMYYGWNEERILNGFKKVDYDKFIASLARVYQRRIQKHYVGFKDVPKKKNEYNEMVMDWKEFMDEFEKYNADDDDDSSDDDQQ